MNHSSIKIDNGPKNGVNKIFLDVENDIFIAFNEKDLDLVVWRYQNFKFKFRFTLLKDIMNSIINDPNNDP